jgi:DNA-binding NtrC family response regulator
MTRKPGTKPLILIADDEEGIRESFKLILEDLYQLEFAMNGADAMQKLKILSPDALFLDIKMPKKHGMDVLKAVKKMRPKLPVVMVTGYQSVEMAQEAIRNGASDYIYKPFETKKILETLSKLI